MSGPKSFEIRCGLYTIRKSSSDLYSFENRLGVFRFFHSLSWSIWTIHVVYDLMLGVLIQRDSLYITWSHTTAILAEFFLTCPEALAALNISLGLFSGKTEQPRPRYELRGEVAPTVDVMITCCGEPIPVVVNTVKAAVAQNYPRQTYRVFVLDDGQDAALRKVVETLMLDLRKTSGPTLQYLSRSKDRNAKSYFKSGNLRFGIKASQHMGEGSDYLAGLDADMIVDPDWLRKMVPHLILDDRVACVCGPQNYYNLPTSDPLGQQAEFDVGYTVQGVLNDCLGAPMCTGTGYLVRRSALVQIGGWPLAYTGEDYMCSALLTGAGWEVIFAREPLQVGLAPESMKALIKQRMRWIKGGHEVHQRLAPYRSSSPLTSKMNPLTRSVNRIYMLRDYSPVTAILAMAVLPLVLIKSSSPDETFNLGLAKYGSYITWSQRLFLAFYVTRTIHINLAYHESGLSPLYNFWAQESWAAPYSAYRCVRSLLPSLTEIPSFTVSGTVASPLNERSPSQRASLLSRFLTTNVLFCSTYVIYASLPFLQRLGFPLWLAAHSSSLQFIFLGPLLKCFTLVWAVSTPVRYMLSPPDVPEWTELVKEGEDGVMRPVKEWRVGKGCKREGLGIPWLIITVFEYTIIWACWIGWR